MRKLKRQIDPEDLRIAVKLYQDGVSLNALCTIFQTSREWMRQRILLFTTLRSQGRQNLRRNRTVTYFQGKSALRMAYAYASKVGYQEVPLSTSRLSKLLSLHSLLIRDLLREQGIPLRRGAPRRSFTASQQVHTAIKRGDIIPQSCEWITSETSSADQELPSSFRRSGASVDQELPSSFRRSGGKRCNKGPRDTNNKRLIVIAHHDDYNYPLVVKWYCRKHHALWHKTNTAIMEGDTPS